MALPQSFTKIFHKPKSNRLPLIISVGLVAIVGVLVYLAVAVFDLTSGINRGGYQAVTLQSGEVYVGKLSSLSGAYVTLNDVYFQQRSNASENDSEQAQVTVQKFTSTVAGPEDTLHIASDKVISWVNLREDSKIVQAIRGTNR